MDLVGGRTGAGYQEIQTDLQSGEGECDYGHCCELDRILLPRWVGYFDI